MPCQLQITNDQLSPRSYRAFTIIEILVVVAVLLILVAITVPALSFAKASAKKAATQALLTAIQTGINSYYSDFNMYPPSSNDNGVSAYLSPPFNSFPTAKRARNRGSAMLAQALTGYLPGSIDGAGPDSNPTYTATYQNDPRLGFRVRKGALGKIYGPYMPDDPKSFRINTLLALPTNPPTQDEVFIDPYGNEILYYRALGNQNAPNPSNLPVHIFASNSIENKTTPTIIALFNSDDDDIDPNGNFINNPAPIQPITGDDIGMPDVVPPAAFFKLLNAPSNVITTTGTGSIPGASTYLLISGGPDKTQFTADDIIMVDH